MTYKSMLAALAPLKKQGAIMAVTGKELVEARAKVARLRGHIDRLEAKRLVKAVACVIIALACLISGTAFAGDVRGHQLPQLIGDWMVAEYPSVLSNDMSYKMTTASVWNYDKDGRRSNCFAGVDDCYKPSLILVCSTGVPTLLVEDSITS